MTHLDQSIQQAQAPGVRITACPRGAHLLTWTTGDIERLWLSPLSHCGEPSAIRGGVPVLFPQFSVFGRLPKHGFARVSAWRPVPARVEPGRVGLAFEMRDSRDTRAIWPTPFAARVDISASPDDLLMSLSVTNSDEYDARFTAGLHTYLAVADPQATITGLGGTWAWDGPSPEQPAFTVHVPDELRALDERDLVIHGATGPVVLHDEVLGALTVTAEGFPDRVVWNPGPAHGLPDIPSGGHAGFVCIEPAAVTPVTLPAGATWVGSQRLTLG